jgi:hypothetical protein
LFRPDGECRLFRADVFKGRYPDNGIWNLTHGEKQPQHL